MSKTWRPATQLVHGGTLRSQYGETSEAIYLTQGFVYDTSEAAEARFKGETDGFIYARYGSPTNDMFEKRMCALEGAEDARATPREEALRASEETRMQIEEGVPLAPRTTLGVGGPAEFFCTATTEADVVAALAWARARGVPTSSSTTTGASTGTTPATPWPRKPSTT